MITGFRIIMSTVILTSDSVHVDEWYAQLTTRLNKLWVNRNLMFKKQINLFIREIIHKS